ncbi:ACR3 family arsenite efflux transporter [Corynebacterium heidelbergense]|uniref:Arsenical-resistance protein n=1 Tax=Corynebacterium heidelbergense TaxID=2055947 RepID=A0A364V4Z7_9CORY|nr:ACR3 family arsenite efflux transporter [Corynebacterium heidelbergense]RAV31697.1 arsenical-resistance protein [Corynebacterium heidelbergense]
MSFLDRWLPLWIIAAMALGLALGRLTPAVPRALLSLEYAGISLPIAVGLLVMMYPPLAKVRYDKTRAILADKSLMVLSVLLNWVLGPLLMFTLAWLFLPGQPELRTGLIIVGLARCIAMVLIWNDLACGDHEAAAVLVAVNSVFQILAFGLLGWFYLQILPAWLGLETTSATFPFWAIVASVLVFLGVPLVAGAASRIIGERRRGRQWYEQTFLPRISPLALIGLLFTIVLLFSIQGDRILAQPLTVATVALPLVAYFGLMFALALLAAKLAHMSYATATTVAFTAAGNNFELAIAVAVGTFGATSAQALAGTIGPLIEVPVLVALVYLMRWLGPRLFPSAPSAPATRPLLVFICVRNAGKSQMAAALAKKIVGDRADVYSAGTHPRGTLNSDSVAAVAEVGATMDGAPKPIDPALLRRATRIVVIGRQAQLPDLDSDNPAPPLPVERWDTIEPSEQGIEGMERMRLIRDDIDRRVRDLLEGLGIPSAPTT